MSLLNLENINFGYGKNLVVENLNLSVERGEFVTLLGSSGCGKTTILRLISGFLNPSKGTIKINDVVQNGILPNKRKIGMVFQDYALFPHLTVKQNLLYGLKIKEDLKGKKDLQMEIVNTTAKNLGIENLLERLPGEISGGQQQRVALGRSLVLEPEILLMDEPLSSLDSKLRIKVREELKEIQSRLKITTVYVTHDQEEALSLSDRIAVMNDGKILQFDSPQNIYFEPNCGFVADFVGRANFIEIENETFVVRPEWISMKKKSGTESGNPIEGRVVSCQFLGEKNRFRIDCNGKIYVCDTSCMNETVDVGEQVSLKFLRKWKCPIEQGETSL